MLPGCQFPPSWRGIWFQAGVRPYISIDETTVSSDCSLLHPSLNWQLWTRDHIEYDSSPCRWAVWGPAWSGPGGAWWWPGAGATWSPATAASSSPPPTPTSYTTSRVGAFILSLLWFNGNSAAPSCRPSPGGSLLSSLCRSIPGDAPLFTLFRVDAASIRWQNENEAAVTTNYCPDWRWKGSFTQSK